MSRASRCNAGQAYTITTYIEKCTIIILFVNTSVLPGYQIYHNYFRPHEALDNKIPAEVCGIKIEGQNKWTTVIQNASLIQNQS